MFVEYKAQLKEIFVKAFNSVLVLFSILKIQSAQTSIFLFRS